VAIGGSPADTGLSSWVFALAALLARPLAGVLVDRWGRKPVLLLGAALFGSGPLLYGWTSGIAQAVPIAAADSIQLLFGARVIHGAGMALFSTAYQAFVADLLPPGRYGEGLGLANVATIVTMVAAPPLGEWVVREVGFGTLFLILGAAGGVGVLVALTLPGRGHDGRVSGPRLSTEQTGLAWALREPGVRVGALGMAVLGVPFGAFVTFLPLLAEARGLGGTGWIFAAYALVSSLVQPMAGRIADRWGAERTSLVGLGLTGLSAVGLAVGDSRWVLVGLAGLFGMGYGAARAGLDACVQGSVGPALRGSAAAIQYTTFDLLVGLGGWGLGWLAGVAGYGMMYIVDGGITLLGTMVCKLSAGRQRVGDEVLAR
jgi:MFS family permease